MSPPVGYHKRPFGSWSKVKEEFEECEDAYQQAIDIMLLVELSDLIGAIEAFLEKVYAGSITLAQVIEMKDATKYAFISGGR